MKLRTKTPVYLGLLLLFIMAVIYLVTVGFVFNATKQIEQQSMIDNINRVAAAIDMKVTNLQTTAGDYGAWDDTYQFVQDKNQKYIDANFGSDSFVNLKVNIVAVFDEDQKLIYARAYDWQNDKEVELPKDFLDVIHEDSDLLTFKDTLDKHANFLRFQNNLMLVATTPILTSKVEGPIKGTVLMASSFDDAYFKRLSAAISVNVIAMPDFSPPTIRSIFTADKVLAPDTQRVINFVDDNNIQAFFTLKNDLNEIEAILKIDVPRPVNILAIDSVKNLFIIFVLLAIILVVGSVYFLDGFILKRLYKFSNAVIHYQSDASEMSNMVTLGKKDELGALIITVKKAFHELDLSRKKVKEHANKSDVERKKLDAILHGIAEGVIVVDSKGKILMVNGMTKKFCNKTYTQLLGSPFERNFKFLDANEKIIDMTFLNPVFTKETILQLPKGVLFFPKNGQPIHMAFSAAPVKRKGEVLAAVIVFKDMTHEYEVDKMKSEFVSIASHQLRTPLTGNKWMISLLLHGKAGKMSKTQLQYIKNIDDSNERMIQLVNDLLNISRIESPDAKKLEKTSVDLVKLIEAAMTEQQNIASELGIILEMDQSDLNSKGSLSAEIDRDKIYQVIMNLLNNAIKYSNKGGVVHITCTFEGGYAKISVRDSGIGIPKNQQSKIFQKFFRADNAMKSITTGTGLGLYYVKTVVEAHGGAITFTSIPDKETTFTFTLPLKNE